MAATVHYILRQILYITLHLTDYNLLSLSFAPKAVTRPQKQHDARSFQESPPTNLDN